VPWFISRGVDRKTRKELEGIRRALERLADMAELHVGQKSGPSLRSFYGEKGKGAVDEGSLEYMDDEAAWAAEQSERKGVTLEEFLAEQSYTDGKTEGEEQSEDVKR